jgi:hypothetical protein
MLQEKTAFYFDEEEGASTGDEEVKEVEETEEEEEEEEETEE